MAAPAGVAIRVIVLRYGIQAARVAGKQIAKRAITSKVRRKPKPPGQTESRGGQHTAIGSGRPGTKARKSMRGPSAQKSGKRSSRSSARSYFRRDEDRYT